MPQQYKGYAEGTPASTPTCSSHGGTLLYVYVVALRNLDTCNLPPAGGCSVRSGLSVVNIDIGGWAELDKKKKRNIYLSFKILERPRIGE